MHATETIGTNGILQIYLRHQTAQPNIYLCCDEFWLWAAGTKLCSIWLRRCVSQKPLFCGPKSKYGDEVGYWNPLQKCPNGVCEGEPFHYEGQRTGGLCSSKQGWQIPWILVLQPYRWQRTSSQSVPLVKYWRVLLVRVWCHPDNR